MSDSLSHQSFIFLSLKCNKQGYTVYLQDEYLFEQNLMLSVEQSKSGNNILVAVKAPKNLAIVERVKNAAFVGVR